MFANVLMSTITWTRIHSFWLSWFRSSRGPAKRSSNFFLVEVNIEVLTAMSWLKKIHTFNQKHFKQTLNQTETTNPFHLELGESFLSISFFASPKKSGVFFPKLPKSLMFYSLEAPNTFGAVRFDASHGKLS